MDRPRRGKQLNSRKLRVVSRLKVLLWTMAVLVTVLGVQVAALCDYTDCIACATGCSGGPDCTVTIGNFWWCCSTQCDPDPANCCQFKCKTYDFDCPGGGYTCIWKTYWSFQYSAVCDTAAAPGECLAN